MLDYRLKIGEKLFPNRVISFVERHTNYAYNGNKLDGIPTLIIQLADAPGVINLDISDAATKNPVFTIIDPKDNDNVITTIDRYTVFGSCDRTLEADGFKTILSMYTDAVIEKHEENVATGKETAAGTF